MIHVVLTCEVCGARSGPCETYPVDLYEHPPMEAVHFEEPSSWRVDYYSVQAYCPDHRRIQ